MFLKYFGKNPVLLMGIVMMGIFLIEASRRGVFQEHREKLMATSCRSNAVKLNRRIPKTWTSKCKNNNLRIEIPLEMPASAKNSSLSKLRIFLFRELANAYVLVARNSAQDNLENINFVGIVIENSRIRLTSITKGEQLAPLAYLKARDLISAHIAKTVKILEAPTK